jgi:hypothetical protein
MSINIAVTIPGGNPDVDGTRPAAQNITLFNNMKQDPTLDRKVTQTKTGTGMDYEAKAQSCCGVDWSHAWADVDGLHQ